MLKKLMAIIGIILINPSIALADAKIEGVYLSSVSYFNKYGSSIVYDYYTLYSDGRAFNGVPPNGPELLDFDAVTAVDAKLVGTYRESGGVVTIAWGGGREASVFPRRPDGSIDLKRGVSTRLVPLPEGQRISGRYEASVTTTYPGNVASYAKSLVFAPDGSFSGKASFAITGGSERVRWGNSGVRDAAGKYAIKGYTVELTHGDGSKTRHLMATYKSEPPAKPEIIYLDGGYMLLK